MLFNWKKKYFRDKMRSVEKMILDLEFSKFKKAELREEVRQMYDNKKAQLMALEQLIASEKTVPTMSKDEAARLDDDKVLIEKDINTHKDQMVVLDVEIRGQAPTNDNPEGIQGINSQIEAFRELVIMIRDYIRIL